MRPVTFDVSNENPATKRLVEFGSFLIGISSNTTADISAGMLRPNLTGWVPYRILEKWKIIEKGWLGAMYRLPQGHILLEDLYPELTPDQIPFNGVQLKWSTVKELAHIYNCDPKIKMRFYLHRYFVTLRNYFLHHFREDAYLWWNYCKEQLSRLKEQKVPTDRILLVLGVAMYEAHRRKNERTMFELQMREAEIIMKALESMQNKFRTRGITRPKLLNKLRDLYDSAFDMNEAAMRHHFKEPESISPLMHLVNLWIVERFLEVGYHQNEACQCAAALYIGFDFFPDTSPRKPFCFKDAKDDKSKVDIEIKLRADRVRKNYDHWKKSRAKLLERLKHDYRRVFGEFEPSDEYMRSKPGKRRLKS